MRGAMVAKDGIESAKLKICRAALHLDEINHVIREAAGRSHTYQVIRDADGEEKINFLIGPPRDLLVIVGEVVYQLRSALDHLAFALVQSNPGCITLPPKWDENCAFPLFLNIPLNRNLRIPHSLPVPYSVFEERLPGISKAAYEFVESVQPYRTGPGTHNILRIIAQLSNTDKHRHLYVMLPRMAVHREVTLTNGTSSVTTIGGLKHGATIQLPDEVSGNPPMIEKRYFEPYITFDETIGNGPDTLESQNVLRVCLEQIETVIIPTFENLVRKP